jgi:hypothetical protein
MKGESDTACDVHGYGCGWESARAFERGGYTNNP